MLHSRRAVFSLVSLAQLRVLTSQVTLRCRLFIRDCHSLLCLVRYEQTSTSLRRANLVVEHSDGCSFEGVRKFRMFFVDEVAYSRIVHTSCSAAQICSLCKVRKTSFTMSHFTIAPHLPNPSVGLITFHSLRPCSLSSQ